MAALWDVADQFNTPRMQVQEVSPGDACRHCDQRGRRLGREMLHRNQQDDHGHSDGKCRQRRLGDVVESRQ